MNKRFKGKRRLKFKYRLGLYLLLICGSFIWCFNFLYNKYLDKIDNETLINYLVDYNLNAKKSHSVFYDFINLNSTNFLLKYTLGVEATAEENLEEISGIEANYVEDPYESSVSEPLVYIYNTHQTEGYQKTNTASYNITPSVLMASYIMRESLNDLGIPSMVETNDITELLRINNWKYSYSYAASKILVKDAMDKNESLKYFIDLHRDASPYEVTTTKMEEKSYARILFVVGKDHENYEENLKLATSLNEALKKINPALTRGISVKGGKGVNGIYNQDLSPNSLLIELGGQYNTITEINNTIPILTQILYNYIRGE